MTEGEEIYPGTLRAQELRMEMWLARQPRWFRFAVRAVGAVDRLAARLRARSTRRP